MTKLKKFVCLQMKNREKIFSWMEQAARLTDEEAGRLRNSLTAEIILATAYIAGCRRPERIIISNLCTLVAAVRVSGVFSHQSGESLAERIMTIGHFPGGNPDAVKAGMLLLELLSLNDHKQDIAADILAGKNNPLIVDLDYEEEKADILKQYGLLPEAIRGEFQGLFDKTIKANIWY